MAAIRGGNNALQILHFIFLEPECISPSGFSGNRGRKRKATPGGVQISLDLENLGLGASWTSRPMAGGGIGAFSSFPTQITPQFHDSLTAQLRFKFQNFPELSLPHHLVVPGLGFSWLLQADFTRSSDASNA